MNQNKKKREGFFSMQFEQSKLNEKKIIKQKIKYIILLLISFYFLFT